MPIEQRILVLSENIAQVFITQTLSRKCQIVDELQPPALAKIISIKSIDRQQNNAKEAMSCLIKLDISPLTKLHGKITAGQTAVALILNKPEDEILKYNLKQHIYAKYAINPNLDLSLALNTENYALLSQAKPKIYSILQETTTQDYNSLTLMVRNEGSGSFLCQSNIGDIIPLALTLSNKFTCPKAEIPMIFMAIGTATSPCVHMLNMRAQDAKKRNISCAPTLIMLGHKNECLDYGLDEVKKLASDKQNNISLINVFSQSNLNNKYTHLFAKNLEDMSSNKNIMYDNHYFECIIKTLKLPHVQIRTAGYRDMYQKFIDSLLYRCDMLSKSTKSKDLKKELINIFADIEVRDAIESEGSQAKDAPKA